MNISSIFLSLNVLYVHFFISPFALFFFIPTCYIYCVLFYPYLLPLLCTFYFFIPRILPFHFYLLVYSLSFYPYFCILTALSYFCYVLVYPFLLQFLICIYLCSPLYFIFSLLTRLYPFYIIFYKWSILVYSVFFIFFDLFSSRRFVFPRFLVPTLILSFTPHFHVFILYPPRRIFLGKFIAFSLH